MPAGLARVFRSILDIFQLLELIQQTEDIKGFCLGTALGGSELITSRPATPVRNGTRSERKHSDLERLLLRNRWRCSSQQQQRDRRDVTRPIPTQEPGQELPGSGQPSRGLQHRSLHPSRSDPNKEVGRGCRLLGPSTTGRSLQTFYKLGASHPTP